MTAAASTAAASRSFPSAPARHDRARRELVHVAGGEDLAAFEAVDDFDELALTRAKRHLLLTRLAVLDDEHRRHAGQRRHGVVWCRQHLFVDVGQHRPLGEEPRLEGAVGVLHEDLDRKRARGLVDRRADVGHLALKRLGRERLDDEVHGLAGLDHGGVLFLDGRLQLERVHLHDRRDRRVLPDELAGLHEALCDRAADRRADGGVVQLLLRQLVGRPAILQARLEAAHVVDGGLVVRLRDLQAGFGGVAVDLVSRPRPFSCCARSNAARASSRFAIVWRTDAICSSGGGCLSCVRSMPSCAST